jgi:radical SAM superfamily enzyme YgiQ (UPF0313 family)
MIPRILLVNPPIYEFAAYDFWLKPYGLLSIAGYLRGKADFTLFDYVDRLAPSVAASEGLESDRWGRGRFPEQRIPSPACLEAIPRHFRRFGLLRPLFRAFLEKERPFDFILVQTMMTYWYPGAKEVIEDVRTLQPAAKIILGGNYVTLCPSHAETLAADLLVQGTQLEPLWEFLGMSPQLNQPALWETYEQLNAAVTKLSDGCPFDCTYCSVPKVYGKFSARPMQRSLAELELLTERHVENIAFYDDALLFDAEKVLTPFLEEILRRNIKVNFHSPNALNARFLTRELANLMVRAGFKTFYLGFESASAQWQKRTGSKVFSDELTQAVRHLIAAGADLTSITAYQLLGHPDADLQQLEDTMHFVNSLSIRGMLADFSPVPGTPDGQAARKWVDMDEPLFHNKTAFPIITLGFQQANRLKDLQRKLNRNLTPSGQQHR